MSESIALPRYRTVSILPWRAWRALGQTAASDSDDRNLAASDGEDKRVSESRGNGAAAVDEYRRALRCSAEDRAVAEAEDEVCRVWTEELARVRHVTELGVASAQAACQAAQMLVHEQQRAGDLGALMRAQQHLERAQDQQRRSEDAARILLTVVVEEVDLMTLAAQERDTVALANRIWVSSASQAVCEAETGSGGGGGTGSGTSDGGGRPRRTD